MHTNSWRCTGLLFFPQSPRRYIFTANHCTCQLFQSLWQVNNSKLEFVVTQWQLFQLMSGQCRIVWVWEVSECFSPDVFLSKPSHHKPLCLFCRWVTVCLFLLLLTRNCSHALCFAGRGGGAEQKEHKGQADTKADPTQRGGGEPDQLTHQSHLRVVLEFFWRKVLIIGGQMHINWSCPFVVISGVLLCF